MSISKTVKQIAHDQGIALFRYPTQIIPEDLPDADAYQAPGYEEFVRLFRPWTQPSFLAGLPSEAVAASVLSPTKLYFLNEFIRSCGKLDGDFFEAGCGSGGSACLMGHYLQSIGARKLVWTLDTFEGYKGIDLDKDSARIEESNRKFDALEKVQQLLKPYEDLIRIVPGMIPATLANVTAKAISFAHIDVNLYAPTYDATCFCLERMTPGGIILFDDYNWPATFGARRAIDEASAKFGCRPIAIPESTQALLIFRGA